MKMMKTKLTYSRFKEFSPCGEGDQFVVDCNLDFSKAWNTCERGDWMIWGLRELGLLDKPTSVRIAVECAKHVLEIYEEKYPDDKRPRRAIESALKWLEAPTEENRLAAAAAAYASDAADAAAYAADAAAYAAAAAAYAAAYAAYAADAAIEAAAAADAAIEAAAAQKTERKWQADKIREIVPNPFE